MELRVVDPKTLLDNPENPRTSAPNVEADRRLAHNIKVVDLLQPPLVRELPDGQLMIIAGHRRRRACVLAKMREMHVIVTSADEKLDGLAAGSENMIREAMTQSEQWRFVDKARREKSHTDAQLARALMVTPAYLKRLSLLAGLHEPILHAIDMGRGPDFNDLKVIAAAPVEEQRAAWAEIFGDMVEDDADPAEYRLNAEDPEDIVPWRELARFLKQARYMAMDARFDEDTAKACGVVWAEDLFGEGGKDNRFTEDGTAYAAAQEQWLADGLPEGGVRMEVGEYGQAAAPDGYRRVLSWMAAEETDVMGYFLNPNTLKIDEMPLRQQEAGEQGAAAPPRSIAPASVAAPKERGAISGTGLTMLGLIRTQALHAALDAVVEDVDPWDLVAALLLALGGQNVSVQTTEREHYSQMSRRETALVTLFPEGVLIRDPALLRQEAVAVLKNVANCTISRHSGSGVTARLMGLLFDADAQMPNMAFDDFLKCFSKPGIMEAGKALKLLPRNTGKEMRHAIMAYVGAEGRWVPEQAGFGPAVEDWKAKLAAMARRSEALASLTADDEEDGDEESGEFDHLFPVEEELYGPGPEGSDEAESIPVETADVGETPDPEGHGDETAELRDAVLEQAVEALAPDDADPEARAAVKAHLDSHLEVVRIAA
ncbi:MAG: ParB/RepB/Spo0J family partition protein [Acetobacter peroxydans]|jgi:ParB/RepB/Spo0J family partition protein|uniref:ParB/RepB/Spo0J family partition protein n=1 Tax=Acetobacter peroxydans TaxID=104098 RepID=UPI002357AEDC|nr:ParB/RepB/Spo0J family partition protein [Acetobacter peroxydans]MCI1411985.1 ParB/RepB/Spo0J family partition protein [Acetobacter peroxydans]